MTEDFPKLMSEFLQINVRYETTGLGSSEKKKQDK